MDPPLALQEQADTVVPLNQVSPPATAAFEPVSPVPAAPIFMVILAPGVKVRLEI
jgi:hypothetical protein